MRLIDADTVRNPYAGTSLEWQGVLLLKLLEDEPTVDAVSVVRCKDCVNFHYRTCGFCYLNPGMPWNVDGNAFCSYGRRKDEIQD